MNHKEKLESKIKNLQDRLEEIKDAEKLQGLRELDAITDEQKIAAFDSLYASCAKYVEHLAENGYEEKDSDHYIFEAAMCQTLGNNVFKVIRPLYG